MKSNPIEMAAIASAVHTSASGTARPRSWRSWLARYPIGRRLTVLVAALMTVIGLMVLVNDWATHRSAAHTSAEVDARFAQYERASGVLSGLLNLRRFEKDVFLNMHDEGKRTSYEKEWAAEMDSVQQQLQAVADHEPDAELGRRVAHARTQIEEYGALFGRIRAGIDDGTTHEAVDANHAMATAKTFVHAAEDDLKTLLVAQTAA